MAAAEEFPHSPEYQVAEGIRMAASKGSFVMSRESIIKAGRSPKIMAALNVCANRANVIGDVCADY
jgi:hypothetical protein